MECITRLIQKHMATPAKKIFTPGRRLVSSHDPAPAAKRTALIMATTRPTGSQARRSEGDGNIMELIEKTI